MPINVDHYEDLAGEVLKVYEEAERKMMKSVANRLNRGVTQPGWTERKYGEMRDVSRVMRGYVDRLSKTRGDMQKQFIEQAFADARSAMISDAQTFANLSEIRGLTANTFKVVNILSELDSSMNAADRMILRKVNDEYAGIVGRTSALVATGSITYREAVQRELNDFANRGITSFVDRAGRSWDMETYAEMATLTAIERATREGYLDSMAEFGYDLAEISDHYGACPICEAWQGVIISVSGNTPGYPSLADAESAGVFHPRCMHDISVYYDGISPEGRKGPRDVGDASPGYSVRAQQRGLERHVRAWKRRMAVAGSPQEERAAYARVRMYQERIRELIEDYNDSVDSSVDHLPRKYWREGGQQKLTAAAKKLPPVVLTNKSKSDIVKLGTNGRFVNNKEKLFRYAEKIVAEPGYTDFVSHGTPDGFIIYMHTDKDGYPTDDGVFYTPKEFAEMIKNSSSYHGGDIRLIACQTGRNDDGAAKQVADLLGVTIKAPTEIVNLNDKGEIFLTDSDVLADLWMSEVKVKQSGKWRIFKPDER